MVGGSCVWGGNWAGFKWTPLGHRLAAFLIGKTRQNPPSECIGELVLVIHHHHRPFQREQHDRYRQTLAAGHGGRAPGTTALHYLPRYLIRYLRWRKPYCTDKTLASSSAHVPQLKPGTHHTPNHSTITRSQPYP